MNDIDLRDLLPPERPMPDGRRREMRERLMIQIETESQHSRRRYRVFAGALAAGILAVAGAAGFLLSNKEEPTETVPSDTTMRPVPNDPEAPDSDQVIRAQYNISGALAAENTWWSQLSAENVLCIDPEGLEEGESDLVTETSVWNEQIQQVDFGQAVTELNFAQVCSSANWRPETELAGGDAYDPGNAVVCVRDGGPAGFPLAIVNLNKTEFPGCEVLAADGVTVREMTDGDTAWINRLRAIEVALLANPDPCPSQAETEEWVASILEAEQLELEVSPVAGDGIPEDSECYQASVNWQKASGQGYQVAVSAIEPPVQPPLP